jgi:hypothetical protein
VLSQAHLTAVKEQYVLTKPCLLREMIEDEMLTEVQCCYSTYGDPCRAALQSTARE